MKFVIKWLLIGSIFLYICPIHADKGRLYIKENCPYCKKVLKRVVGITNKVEIVSIFDSKFKEELLQKGGKIQVPCLIHEDFVLYESEEIIKYLNHEVLIE